eukprot:1613688-Pleurochrysis_carterae.AAC.1
MLMDILGGASVQQYWAAAEEFAVIRGRGCHAHPHFLNFESSNAYLPYSMYAENRPPCGVANERKGGDNSRKERPKEKLRGNLRKKTKKDEKAKK